VDSSSRRRSHVNVAKGCFGPLLLLAIDRRRSGSSPGRIEVAFVGYAQAGFARERSAIGVRVEASRLLKGRALFTRVDVVA
jgi:hypothetical protein